MPVNLDEELVVFAHAIYEGLEIPEHLRPPADLKPVLDEVQIELAPLVKVLDSLLLAHQRLLDMTTGPELMQLIEDLDTGKKAPQDELDNEILRVLRGPTRFERINES